MKKLTINEEHQDILREIGNIGSGSAVTSLSQMLQDKLEMYLPHCLVVNKNRLGDLFADSISLYVGVSMKLEGNMECVIAILLNREFATTILDKLTGEPLQDVQHMTDIQKSAICEVGNIMCNSYITAFSSLMNANIPVSVPRMTVDTGERVLHDFIKEYLSDTEELLFITNTFSYKNQAMESHILFHPNDKSLEEILTHLT